MAGLGGAGRWDREGDHLRRWLVVALMAVVAALGLRVYDVRFDASSAVASGGAVVFLAALMPVYYFIGREWPVSRRAVAVATDFVWSILQLVVMLQIALPISYLAARLGAPMPLLDASLARFDAVVFGFDWDRVARWVEARPTVDHILGSVYFTLSGQALALLVLGSLVRPGRRNSELIWLAIVAVLLTAMISTVTPAFGELGQIGAGRWQALAMIRSGRWTLFSYAQAEGIVTFPSFHTTMALLYPWIAGRLHPLLLVVFVPLNLVMLLSVCPIGGHYLVDVFGGAAVALVSIAVVTGAGRRRAVAATALA